jgi:hypothetical protein
MYAAIYYATTVEKCTLLQERKTPQEHFSSRIKEVRIVQKVIGRIQFK